MSSMNGITKVASVAFIKMVAVAKVEVMRRNFMLDGSAF